MTGWDTVTYELTCDCRSIRKALPAHWRATEWMRVLEVSCRIRGCRCPRHAFGRADRRAAT